MGYCTWFDGEMEFDNPISNELINYINKFSETRRMKRDIKLIKLNDPDWEKHCFNGNLGPEGAYYIGDDTTSILDYNNPPEGQPGLWCGWIIGEEIDSHTLQCNELEKFYHYFEWLQYLIDHFLKTEGLRLVGEISFEGEDSEDAGVIDIVDIDGEDHVRCRYYERVLESRGTCY